MLRAPSAAEEKLEPVLTTQADSACWQVCVQPGLSLKSRPAGDGSVTCLVMYNCLLSRVAELCNWTASGFYVRSFPQGHDGCSVKDGEQVGRWQSLSGASCVSTKSNSIQRSHAGYQTGCREPKSRTELIEGYTCL